MNPEAKSQAWLNPANGFFLWLFVLGFLPSSILLLLSFFSKGASGELWTLNFTLNNYIRLFDWIYFRVFLKTLWVASSSTFLCLLVGFPVAYYLTRADGAMKKWGLILLFIPFWTNCILRLHGIISIVGNKGLLNQLLISSGLIDSNLEILYTRLGVYIGLVYNYLPFLVVPIYSALEKLDPSLKEAAFDLGANRLQTFLKITLPQVWSGVFIGCLFVFIPMLGEYVIPDLLGGAKEVFLGNLLVSQFFTMQDWPFGSAIATLLASFLLLAIGLYKNPKNLNTREEVWK